MDVGWFHEGVVNASYTDLFTPVAYPAKLEKVCFGMVGLNTTTLPVEVVVHAADGVGGAPGTELLSIQATAFSQRLTQPAWNLVDLSDLDFEVLSGSVYIGIRWAPNSPPASIAADTTANGRPAGFAGGHYSSNFGSGDLWRAIISGGQTRPNYRSLMIRASFDSGAPPLTFPKPYCQVHHESLSVAPISRVTFAGIDNASSAALGGGNPAHEDFLQIFGQVEAGLVYEISVEGNTAGDFTDQVRVFFDWNGDGQFDLETESVLVGDLHNSTGTDGIQATAEVTIPVSIEPGEYRMRVVKRYHTEENPAFRPCAVTGRGQAEDYTVIVASGDLIFYDGFESLP